MVVAPGSYQERILYMSKQKSSADQKLAANGMKTWAIRIPSAKHERLVSACKDAGMSMQVIADQMIDAFLDGQIKLKRQVFVPNEMAAALADPTMFSKLMQVVAGAQQPPKK